MLLSLIIIVALIWAAVIGTIYSNFLVFYSNFAETENYHKAYYASIAALERAELVTKQRQPWYENRWWWDGDNYPSNSRQWSDWPIETDFSYLSQDSHRNSRSYRDIKSLTEEIPYHWNWDVDRMLSANDSNNYNMMNYNDSEIFLLYKDPIDNDNPYTKKGKQDMIKVKLNGIGGEIRLPSYLRENFWELDTQHGLLWSTTDKETDDAIVDRQVSGKYGSTQLQPFTIFATQRTDGNHIIPSEDTAIRESDLNETYKFIFGWSKDPKAWRNNRNWTLISPSANVINQENFSQILYNDEFSQTQIRFSLLNHLKTKNWNIYPFLEYRIAIKGTDKIPDKYYTINSEWRFWDYLVNLTIIKPTIKRSILKSFTTIF